jgi:hypothetical protein
MNLKYLIINELNSIPEISQLLSRFKIFDTYIAGGFIRDLILDNPINDIDIFIDAPLNEVNLILKQISFNGNIVYGPFGSPRLFFNNYNYFIDIIPFSHFVIFNKPYLNIESILSDFDITINAIAFSINSEKIIDPIGGLVDLEKKIIKSPHLKFPDKIIKNSVGQISTLTIFWFRLNNYKKRFNFSFESSTLEWYERNSFRLKYFDIYKRMFIDSKKIEKLN